MVARAVLPSLESPNRLMKLKTRSSAALALLAGFAVSGCSSDSTGPDAGIEQAVALQIHSVLFTEVMLAAFDALSELPLAPGQVPGQLAPGQLVDGPLLQAFGTIDGTANCAPGGTIHVQGAVTDFINEDGDGSVSLTLLQTPQGCVVETGGFGTYTINGQPNLTVDAEIAFTGSGQSFTGSFAYGGGYSWTGGGKSGTCSLDYTMNFAFPSQAVSLTGMMCGHSLN